VGKGGSRRAWYPGKQQKGGERLVCLKHGRKFKSKSGWLAHFRGKEHLGKAAPKSRARVSRAKAKRLSRSGEPAKYICASYSTGADVCFPNTADGIRQIFAEGERRGEMYGMPLITYYRNTPLSASEGKTPHGGARSRQVTSPTSRPIASEHDLNRIRKLVRLTQSPNANEAKVALRRAIEGMERLDIEQIDV
jgi:hypothetical protein